MLTYADVCSRMLAYADACSRMLTYADASVRCGVHFTAAELNDHQLSECQERFVLCKHGCGELVKVLC